MDIEKLVITDKLSELGLNMSLEGFRYLVEAVALPEHEKQMHMYKSVAEICGVKATQVERNLRHCIDSFYSAHTIVPKLFMPNPMTGTLTISEFVPRARLYVWRNTGVLEDGSYWSLFATLESDYVIRYYTTKGNYDAFKGSLAQCTTYLKNLIAGVG